MKDSCEQVYGNIDIRRATKVTLWERLLLLFVPEIRVETKDFVSRYKRMFGKFYVVDYQKKGQHAK